MTAVLGSLLLCLAPALAAEPVVERVSPPELSATPVSAEVLPTLPPALPTLDADLSPDLARAKSVDNPLSTERPAQTPQPVAALPQAREAYRAASASAKVPDPEPNQSSELFDGAGRAQLGARAAILAQRAATLPAHVWPFTRLAASLSHGEGMAGLTPRGAARVAEKISRERRVGTIVGRLSWELHDAWSVRGAVRSYSNLIDELARAKKKNPALDAAVSLDVEALGAQLDGLSYDQRFRVTLANVVALAKKARDAGLPVELDVGASSALPIQVSVARALVRDHRIPVGLAIAARYDVSPVVLRAWAALARQTGLTLGVRLVKGSFIEGDKIGAVNFRGPLLEQYKRLITEALRDAGVLDVAVATHNEEIWRHAQAESDRLEAKYSVHVIRGVNAPLQEKMRAAGVLSREYVSYGLDTPVMGVMELWTNWRQKRALEKRFPGAAVD